MQLQSQENSKSLISFDKIIEFIKYEIDQEQKFYAKTLYKIEEIEQKQEKEKKDRCQLIKFSNKI